MSRRTILPRGMLGWTGGRTARRTDGAPGGEAVFSDAQDARDAVFVLGDPGGAEPELGAAIFGAGVDEGDVEGYVEGVAEVIAWDRQLYCSS